MVFQACRGLFVLRPCKLIAPVGSHGFWAEVVLSSRNSPQLWNPPNTGDNRLASKIYEGFDWGMAAVKPRVWTSFTTAARNPVLPLAQT